MQNIILQTDRAHLCYMKPEDVSVMTDLLNLDEAQALGWITENIHQQHKSGFSIFNVFSKQTGQYIGYCGCSDIEFKNHPEIQLKWYIYKDDKLDETDIEVVFAVRNYMFKKFAVPSLIAFIESDDPQGMNVAEAIDMETEYSVHEDNLELLVYIVDKKSKKFAASFGDGESPKLTSSINRDERSPFFVKNLKTPRPRPKPNGF